MRLNYEKACEAFSLPEGDCEPWPQQSEVDFDVDEEIEAWDRFIVEWNERESRLRRLA